MRIRTKIWLEDESGEAIFGEGRKRILELIEELGSMQAAARALSMSYRGVWARVKTTEDRLGIKLIETAVGRGKNRGSRLTPEARRLLDGFRLLIEDGVAHTDRMFARIMAGEEVAKPDTTPAAAVIGPPGAGVSALTARLVAAWKEKGRRVGVIRLADSEPGTPPVDDEALAAGSPVVVQASADRLAVSLPPGTDLDPEAIAANYAHGVDFCLVEAGGRVHLPTIEVHKRDVAEKLLTRRRKDILAVVGDPPLEHPDWPHYGLDDLEGLMSLVEDRILTAGPRPLSVQLTVNGRRIPMLSFVQDIVVRGVLGMVSSLKSCQRPEWVELNIRRPLAGSLEEPLE